MKTSNHAYIILKGLQFSKSTLSLLSADYCIEVHTNYFLSPTPLSLQWNILQNQNLRPSKGYGVYVFYLIRCARACFACDKFLNKYS